jgi:hypothetical protein
MRFNLWTGAAAVALLSLANMPANAQTGSFQSTCRNIGTNGSMLVAECRDPSGKFHSTSLNYTQCKGDIGNNNGSLFCNGATAAPANVNGGNANGNSGRGNGNGPGNAAAADPAAGSFRSTCRNIQTSGSTLSAECADTSGRYRGSSIAFTQCRGDIGNNNGMLSCNGATGVASNNGNNGSNNNGNNGGFNNGNGRGDNGQRGNNGSNGGNNFGPPPGPRYDDQPRYGNGGPPPAFTPGPYAQFDASERSILQDIQDGRRYGRLSRHDADDLTDQLQQIQDREARIYRAQGRYIRADDARRIDHDLDMLSMSVRRLSHR